MSHVPAESLSSARVGLGTQCAAWLLGMGVCVLGMCSLIANWDKDLAAVQFVLLAVAPAAWMIQRRRIGVRPIDPSGGRPTILDWSLALAVGSISLVTCFLVGYGMEDLPPAYHDEYSYLFQAKTLITGRFSFPSHAVGPELFDQMHVLNDGRMASRYYPGTGFWLAPFVAMGRPYWGQWLASGVASACVYWTGLELATRRVAIISGLTCALSPGIALFSNLLLAHQATMASLGIFVLFFVRWQRTRAPFDAFLAGCGLSYAMLCRPATAAGAGLPFGLAFLYWMIMGRSENLPNRSCGKLRSLAAIGLPIIAGWLVMLAYNKDVTGDWTTSPYQLYTDIYTPRHVYGFNNVIRGSQSHGPKVIESYDRWAQNLTVELAAENLFNRWVCSWLWTFDILPQLISTVIVLGSLRKLDRRWILIACAIASLHALHFPYWYVGIMGWHYVFETAPLWCLFLGLGTDLLLSSWRPQGRWLMPAWWSLLLLISLAGNYLPLRALFRLDWGAPKIAAGIGSIQYPRRQYAEFDDWLKSNVTIQPALVLIDADPDDQHMDYVVNSPGLNDSILRGRFRRGLTDMNAVINALPGRAVYLCQPEHRIVKQLSSPKPN